MMAWCRTGGLIYVALLLAATASAQQVAFPSPLDLGRSVKPLAHLPLPEEYIWTAGDVTALRSDHAKFPWSAPHLRVAPHRFRVHFDLKAVPAHATLYIAGPRESDVFLNGRLLAHFASDIDAPIGFHVFHARAERLLRAGANTLAVQAIRGHGIVSGDASPVTQQLSYGEVLAVKLLNAPTNRKGATLVMSDQRWRSITAPASDRSLAWTQPTFVDTEWPRAMSLGPVEGNRDLLQWSADAGMYAWPGYQGISSPLGIYPVLPVAITHVFAGNAVLEHLDALTEARPMAKFAVQTPFNDGAPTDGEAPSLLVDFGREIAGRLLVESDGDKDALLSIAYGESELEALATGLTPGQRGGNYLGTNSLEVPAHGSAAGPKSAFRYVRVRFLRGGPRIALRSIRAEAIAYPVSDAGSFESSDPMLNRIWETAAYTAHLCMGDDLWDAPKRDRGRWAGDIDVEGRVILEVFGEETLIERTLASLAPAGTNAVNGIPNYSALWITSLQSLYTHRGNLAFLQSQHSALLGVLGAMDASLNPEGAFVSRGRDWPFIDWAPQLCANTPQTALGTNIQYLRGYRAAAALLDIVGDAPGAARARAAAAKLEEYLHRALPRGNTEAAPLSWQIAALLVQEDLLAPAERQALWSGVLAHVKQDSPQDNVISPYFNLTVLDAMASLGHRREALAWLRTYWGGMLDEGATSFWESYDLRWPKDNPHLSLQADGTSGFFVSLAHGWSSGPTAWLSENVLGVRDPVQGYRTVLIAPRLLGLAWARGSVPTPHGPIRVSVSRARETEHIEFDIPEGVDPTISLEPGSEPLLDGKTVTTQPGSDESRLLAHVGAGKHSLSYTPKQP